jgi:hypothetical protein
MDLQEIWYGLDSCRSEGPVMTYCEHGNETSGSITGQGIYCLGQPLLVSQKLPHVINFLPLTIFILSVPTIIPRLLLLNI